MRMEDLSLHVLDVVENSIAAAARRVVIRIVEDTEFDQLLIVIADDGHGMDKETVQRALDPFFSTRGTKRIGLGIPLLAQAARESDGSLELLSEVGTGTTIRARFRLSHPDRKPLGDMPATVHAGNGPHASRRTAGACDPVRAPKRRSPGHGE